MSGPRRVNFLDITTSEALPYLQSLAVQPSQFLQTEITPARAFRSNARAAARRY
jgi:hypothetical protein